VKMDMNVINVFLLQFAFIVIQIFVYQIFFAGKAKKKGNRNLILSVLCGVSILLCMSFPANSTSAVDIRIVPLLIGTLYGGMRTGLFLSAVIIIYRLYIGPVNLGFYNTVLTLITSMPVILYFQKVFHRSEKRRKMQIALLLPILYSVIGVTLLSILSGTFEILHVHNVVYIIFTTVVVWLLITLNETLRDIQKKNYQLESEADRIQFISNLTGAFAHEIRNPMQVTRGFLQLLNEPDLPNKKKDYIRYSLEELDRANGIINDLLSFGKPASNENTRIEVTLELSRVVNIIQTLAMSNNVEIQTVFHADCWIQADPQKFRQMVINILKNAIESMPNGGTVWLTCRMNNNFIEIGIKDQGMGMTKEQVEKLGSPFYSLKENGTGLGMMVTFQIIRNFGGEVKINSEKDVGTEFLIRLPKYNILQRDKNPE
jgi:two-component system, sporulation sensor kinase B